MTTIPAEALNQHMAIVGMTGSGKTYTAKGIVETLLANNRQVCIIDPTSAWWGLRLAANGKSKGFDVVLLGGNHGDLPLAERSGSAVARLVTEQLFNCIIDTGAMTVGEYTRWFTEFAGTLYTTVKNPVHLIIDEAHYFMPQGKVISPDAGKMLHAGNRLMSGGRSKGIRAMMITQRPAKLHKDSLTCANTLIAMRVIAPQDRKAIKEWIDGCGNPEQGKAVLDSLAKLKKGEGWIWYPEGEFLKPTIFPHIKTYDSSSTPTERFKAAPKIADIDLSEVRAAMAEAVKDAEANDPKLLRARISELERELKNNSRYKTDPKINEAELDKALAARDREWQLIVRDCQKLIGDRNDRLAKIENIAHLNGQGKVDQQPPPKPKSSPPPEKPPTKIVADRGPDSSLPIGESSILRALIQFPEGLERSQLTVLTGYKRSSRDAYIARLARRGFVDTSRARLAATDEGHMAMPDAEQLPTGEALQRYWFDRLPEGERKILERLVEHHPSFVTRETLTDETEYKRSSRDAYIARLKAKQLVVTDSHGVRASDELF